MLHPRPCRRSHKPAHVRAVRPVRALMRRLNLMPQGVRVGSTRYHSPVLTPSGDEIEILLPR